jgi:hypothetical protein
MVLIFYTHCFTVKHIQAVGLNFISVKTAFDSYFTLIICILIVKVYPAQFHEITSDNSVLIQVWVS